MSNVQQQLATEATLERLRKEREDHSQREYESGVEAGRQWVNAERRAASASELARLERLRDRKVDIDEWQEFFEAADAPAEFFRTVIAPADDYRLEDQVSEWWESIASVTDVWQLEPEFIRGFADGALEVWAEV